MKQNLNPVTMGVIVCIAVLVVALIGWKVFGTQSSEHRSGNTGNAAYDEYQKTGKIPDSVSGKAGRPAR